MVDFTHPAPPAQPAVPVTLGRTLRPAGDGVLSALPPGDEGAPYDRRAAAYDRLVASPLYNRLLWRTSPRTYAAFAAEALHAGDGPLLDVACGSGVFTAAAYRHADRPLVLADRSLAMLGRARGRLGLAAPEVSFVQADLFDLPFAAGAFETVACHGALHVFDDLPEALRALRAQLAPGGTLYVTSLVAETPIAARYLALLHHAGEVATPRRQADLLAHARAELGDVTARRHGAMCFLTART